MPYIKKERREQLDPGIIELRILMDNLGLSQDQKAGILNYCISQLLDYMKPDNGWNYSVLNDTVGVVNCAGLEFYRRKVAPYEDIKIKENGDIGTYE